MSTRTCARTARRRRSSARCRRATTSTNTSATTTTSRSSTPFSQRQDRQENSMSAAPEAVPSGPKPKKSVALSGVAAGNTALCTVGRTGNDLHYRGYDILDLADKSEFEEVAYLLIHGKLPNRAELKGYKDRLRRLRGLPVPVRAALEAL